MSIPAKRFTFLDEETNIGITDFFTGSNTDILNSPINELKSVSADIEEFLTNAVDKGSLLLEDAQRMTDDLLSNMEDLTGLDAKAIMEQVKTLIPDNPIAQSLFNQLDSTCKGRALGRSGSGRPYGSQNSCNGSKRPAGAQCGGSSKAFGSAIQAMSGGQYNFNYEDFDSQFNSLTSLSSMGYDMNMCNVFSTLSSGLPNDLTSRASGQLVDTLTKTKNIVGLFDLSSASGGLTTKLFNPNTTTAMLSNFIFPKEIRERDSSSLADRYTAAMEIFDEQWSQSEYDQMLSTKGVSNVNMRELMRRRSLDNIYTQDMLDVVPDNDHDFLLMAY